TRQLAGHLAGIRHYRDREFLLNRRFATVRDGLAIFQDDSLLFPPGTRFSYSSYGWNLVSAVVEGASGEDFLPYISAHVFRPLGLTHTSPDRADSLGHRWAFHGGSAVGGTAVLGVDRDAHLVVALLTNLSDAAVEPAQEIEAAFERLRR